jgi:hypothetical protein
MTIVKKDTIGHERPYTDEDRANCARVQEFANKLGLHGVMILSARCPDCGNLHGFQMVTDLMADIEQEGTEVATLLRYFADTALTQQPFYADEDLPRSQ